MDLAACASEPVELIVRIPGVGEAILLNMTDDASSSGTAWITSRSVIPLYERTTMLLDDQKNYLENLGMAARFMVEHTEDNDMAGTFLNVASREDMSLVVMWAELISRPVPCSGKTVTPGYFATARYRTCSYNRQSMRKNKTPSEVPTTDSLFTKIVCPADLSGLCRETIAWVARMDAVFEIVLGHIIHYTELLKIDSRLKNLNRDCSRSGTSRTGKIWW